MGLHLRALRSGQLLSKAHQQVPIALLQSHFHIRRASTFRRTAPPQREPVFNWDLYADIILNAGYVFLLFCWCCAQRATSANARRGKQNTLSVLLVRWFLRLKVSSDYDINEHCFRTLHVLNPVPATAQPVRTYNFVACVLDLPISVFVLQPASLLAPACLSTLKFLSFRNPVDSPAVMSGCVRHCAVFSA